MNMGVEITEEADVSVLVAQIAQLKHSNHLLFLENDGLKNELRNKNEEIKDLQIKIHQQQNT
jgi:regulator of replication initiation timing